MLRRMKGATKIDFRITWIRKVVECLLTVTDRVVLDNFLKEEEGQNERLLRQVCDGRVSQWSASSKRPDGPKEKDTVPSSSEDTCPRFPYVKFWTTTEEVEVEEDVVRASTYIAETEATDESEAEEGEIAAAEDGVERGKELEAPVPSSRMAKDAATLSTDMSSLNLSKEGDAALSIASQMSPIGSMATVDDDRPESGASTVDAEIQKITMKKRVFRIVLHSEVGPVKQLEPLSSEEADRLADDPSGQQWLYLIRTTCGPIPIPDSEEAACREMPQHFEVDFTDTLEAEGFLDLLTQVYFPLIKVEHRNSFLNNDICDLQQIMSRPHHQVLAMQEFLREVDEYDEYLCLQREHDLKLFFVVTDDLKDVELEDLAMPCFIERLEVVCGQWTKTLEKTVSDMQNRLQLCSTPLEEVAFWNEADRFLGDILNSLQEDRVQAILKVLLSSGRSCIDNFNFHKDELELFLRQSQEAALYMNILKPSFLILEKEPSLSLIRGVILDIVPTLRLVWSTSRYLSTAERMAPLMHRIASLLGDRVLLKIHIENVLSYDHRSKCKLETLEAVQLLEDWKKSYLDVRASSDSTGQVPPWEFDRKKLFERTDYMAGVCRNMDEVYEVLEQFDNTLIPEMDAAFYETEHFQRLRLKVDELPQRVFNLSYNPLELGNGAMWKCVMEHFRREVELIDMDFLQLLDDGFGHLRGVQAASKLLQALDAIECRPIIKSHVQKKMDAVTDKLLNEIDDISTKFERCVDEHLVLRNLPPVTSSVFWSRRLLKHIDASVAAFYAVPHLDVDPSVKDTIDSKHAALAASIHEFGNTKFQAWSSSKLPQIKTLLQEPLLRKEPSDDSGSAFNYKVNFPMELLMIITEAKHLEILGYVIPVKIRLVALQLPMYTRQIFLLKSVVRKVQRWKALCNVEQDQQYRDFRQQLDRACNKINWTSLSVDTYLEHCLVSW